MRFLQIKSDPFTRVATGSVSQNLKRALVLPIQDTIPSILTYSISGNEQLDMMAMSFYGTHYKWYALASRNVREIVGWKARFNYILSLKVPPATVYP